MFFPVLDRYKMSNEKRAPGWLGYIGDEILPCYIVLYMRMYDALGGGFKYFLFSPLCEEMIQFDEHIFSKWVETTN